MNDIFNIGLKVFIVEPVKKFVRDFNFNSEITVWVSFAQEYG